MALHTLGSIAALLGVREHCLKYVLATRQIDPVAFAGRYRLYDDAALNLIRQALAEVAAAPTNPSNAYRSGR
jgi:hypothetical protein